jgi:hypothetical protein
MIISDENSYPIIIDSIDTPLPIDHFWILDLNERDFMLNDLLMLEEIVTPIITFNVSGYIVEAPADWNILIYSPDTSQIDVIEISELTKGDYSAFLFDHKHNKVTKNTVTVVDYNSYGIVHTPTMNKNAMLCHTAGPHHWICIAPTDNYNKLLRDCAVGDIIP